MLLFKAQNVSRLDPVYQLLVFHLKSLMTDVSQNKPVCRHVWGEFISHQTQADLYQFDRPLENVVHRPRTTLQGDSHDLSDVYRHGTTNRSSSGSGRDVTLSALGKEPLLQSRQLKATVLQQSRYFDDILALLQHKGTK